MTRSVTTIEAQGASHLEPSGKTRMLNHCPGILKKK